MLQSCLKYKSLQKNYGFFFLSCILLLYLITLIIFWLKSFIKLKHDINKVSTGIKTILIKKEKDIKKPIKKPMDCQ